MRKLTYLLFSLVALMLFVSPLAVQAATQAEIDACINSPDCKYIDGELLKKRTLPDGQIVFGLPSQVHPNDKKVVNGQTQWRYHGYNEKGDPYTNSDFPHDADSGRSVCQKNVISKPWDEPWWQTSPNDWWVTDVDWDYILSNIAANTGCLNELNTKILHYNPDTGAFSVRVWHRNDDGSIWYETFDNFAPPPPPKLTCDNLNLQVRLGWGGTKVLDYLPADISNTVSVSVSPPAGTMDQLANWSVVYDDHMMMSAESGTFGPAKLPIDGNIVMNIEKEDKGNVFINNVVAKVTLTDGTVCTRAAGYRIDARGEPPPPSMPSGKMPSGITNVRP